MNPQQAPKPKKSRNKRKKNKKGKSKDGIPKSVQVPVAQTRPYVNNGPKIVQRSLKSARFTHREWVDNILSSATAWTPVKYPLNPGIDQTFSWLSNNAINWERYKFHRLSFHYLTRSPTSTTGSLILAPDYDAADSAPVDEMTAMSYANAREDAVWKDVKIECDLKSMAAGRTDHFVRVADPAPNLDIRIFDCGNLWVANDCSLAVGTIIGKLFVEYDVEFFTPQLPPTGDPLIGTSSFTSGGTLSVTAPLGQAPVNNALNSMGQVFYNAADTGNDIIAPEDVITSVLTFASTGTGLTNIVAPTITASSPGPARQVKVQNAPLVNAAGTSIAANYILENILAGDTIHLPGLTGTSATGANAIWSRLAGGIL